MHRIDTSTASGGKFVNGNASQGIKGTQVDAPWLNSVQEEICKVIESESITLSTSDNTQLYTALKKLARECTDATAINGSFSGTIAASTAKTLASGIAVSVGGAGGVVDLSVCVVVNSENSSSDTLTVSINYDDGSGETTSRRDWTIPVYHSGCVSVRYVEKFSKASGGTLSVVITPSASLACSASVNGVVNYTNV